MKLFVALVVLVMSIGAFAQKHMVEFNTESVVLGTLNFSTTKTKGSEASEDKIIGLAGNYAYSVTDHVQVGTQLAYTKLHSSINHVENYSVLVGGIYNLDADFRKSVYASLYAGWSWENSWAHDLLPTKHDENFITRVALGKRIPLSMFNLENVTYSPEVAFRNTNPLKSSSDEWSQELQIKFLQFSIFF